MDFPIQELFILFIYEFQPATFHASNEKTHPQYFPAPKQSESHPTPGLFLFSRKFSTPSAFHPFGATHKSTISIL